MSARRADDAPDSDSQNMKEAEAKPAERAWSSVSGSRRQVNEGEGSWLRPLPGEFVRVHRHDTSASTSANRSTSTIAQTTASQQSE
ncbi:hypothetical protein DC31_17140 [Microbacterium sp. CH12i]|nr:hypothetical protein DC31_17140 [Microbacterium sp. CH12i]